ncbi:PDDEXK nuclease domain-containing protein [Limnofasciculus baicalensis]|uniref:PDDEXK nuclease domain-containing protein n=1 Tax=Limnofasciculus baicalensis BBK-W-15 TaxID=2699891 RepID=A0AAE3GSJ0_9CYAN|nr:PDDEXK nuclease domain-containing protein [Limnofasciculus baicalensis]MCP2729965.1 PDDEXK nuclease domain-containing protein [Limnofasciculus baicalensis BBK-W-15]
MADSLSLPEDYNDFLRELKERIRSAKVRAALSINRELVLIYWQIGQDILNRQQQEGWGAKVIDLLATDLRKAFPEMKGFSSRNLKYMRSFAEAYPDLQLVQEVLALISWYHNIALIEKVKASEERLWYARETIKEGWSRNVLVHQIESGLYRRQGKADTNFSRTLPNPQSELAQQLLKDPYNFDFISLGKEAHERELEKALIERIRDFLLELGVGFAFVGSQYHLEVEGEDFYIDLLFYHLRLRCFVAIDLKVEAFKPEFSGKMSFYVSAVDDLLRHRDDMPTIGIILCKDKKQKIVEYALRDMNKPIGVSTYQLREALPEELQGSLPTVEELEAELEAVDVKIEEEG